MRHSGAPAFDDRFSAYKEVLWWANRYNTRRRRSAIGSISPIAYETAASTTLTQAA